ncbi:MAG: DUF4145 domain-containing protein [Deltaproteobacteria bacterium]|nr:DUF4145 domain-containing protein [Deltaproteobacteria bacterium]
MPSYLPSLRLYSKAHRYLRLDPEVSLMLARKTAEGICRYMFSQTVSSNPGEIMLEKLIEKFTTDKLVPKRILTALRTIQQYGNYGAHDQEDSDSPISEDDAQPCIMALDSVYYWFLKEYIGVNPKIFTRIDEMNLHPRSEEMLNEAGITYLGELVVTSEEELLAITGRHYLLREIRDRLSSAGLSIGMQLDEKTTEELKRMRVPRDKGSRK